MNMGPQQHLSIVICQDAADACAQGFDYAKAPRGEYKPIELSKAVVVRDGTESNKPTVDFVLTDETGQKYVVMLTGALIKSIPCG